MRYFDARGWGGVLVARLHYLSPLFLYIIFDVASIAAPNTNFLMVFQVNVAAGQSQMNLIILPQAVRASMALGTFIKTSLGTAASSDEK